MNKKMVFYTSNVCLFFFASCTSYGMYNPRVTPRLDVVLHGTENSSGSFITSRDLFFVGVGACIGIGCCWAYSVSKRLEVQGNQLEKIRESIRDLETVQQEERARLVRTTMKVVKTEKKLGYLEEELRFVTPATASSSDSE